MAEKYHIEELDEDTQEYLRVARDGQGEGMPGVYVPKANYLPIIGASVGGVLILLTVILTLPPTGDAFKTAMLQVAGLLLGGWMVVAAFRVWLARGGRGYLGHFVYADASNLYEVAGSTVTVAPLNRIHSANGVDNHNNEGNYQNTTIDVYLGKKQQYSVTVTSEQHARQLVVFLNALAFMRTEGGPELQALSPFAKSERALALAVGEERGGGTAVAFDTLPEPTRASPSYGWLIACGVILVLAIFGLFVMTSVNGPLRDDTLYDRAKSKRPPDLRGYLIDPRNTRHRDAAEKRLASFYDQHVIPRLRAAGRDAEMRDGFIALVDRLKTAVEPVVSIRVQEQAPNLKEAPAAGHPLHPEQSRTRESEARKQMVDTLTNAVSDGSRDESGQLREDMVQFLPDPEGAPAMVDVTWIFTPEALNPNLVRLEWTVTVRPRPKDQGVTRSWSHEKAVAPADATAVVRAEVSRTLLAMVGQDRPQGVLLPGNPGFNPNP